MSGLRHRKWHGATTSSTLSVCLAFTSLVPSSTQSNRRQRTRPWLPEGWGRRHAKAGKAQQRAKRPLGSPSHHTPGWGHGACGGLP